MIDDINTHTPLHICQCPPLELCKLHVENYKIPWYGQVHKNSNSEQASLLQIPIDSKILQTLAYPCCLLQTNQSKLKNPKFYPPSRIHLICPSNSTNMAVSDQLADHFSTIYFFSKQSLKNNQKISIFIKFRSFFQVIVPLRHWF